MESIVEKTNLRMRLVRQMRVFRVVVLMALHFHRLMEQKTISPLKWLRMIAHSDTQDCCVIVVQKFGETVHWPKKN